MKKSTLVVLSLFTLSIIVFVGCDPDPDPEPEKGMRPIVFVHGMAGSGDQFQAQALRFASSGYPDNYFAALDHNSIGDVGRQNRLDRLIDHVLDETGADKVDLVGHSMGTAISTSYLSTARHAAKVAHYVNVDGVGGDELPGGVPTLNLMASSMAGEITGATNVYLQRHTHVQACSSPESFAWMYDFFTGKPPTTTDILPATSDTIALEGKLVVFVTNAVPENIDLSIFEVNPDTAQRIGSSPVYAKPLASDGTFTLTNAKQGSAYEFVATRSGEENEGHWFYEPFVRTDTLIRLKYTEPGSILYNMLDTSDDSVAVIIVRNREMLGEDAGGTGVDSLTVNGTEICDGVLPASGPIGLVVFDEDADGVSDLSAVADAYRAIPFVNGVDLLIPATPSGGGIVTITMEDRYSGAIQTINIPDRPSTIHKSFVQFIPR
jgi:pimeloyl-ACP methyl ester carboxylesterase